MPEGLLYEPVLRASLATNPFNPMGLAQLGNRPAEKMRGIRMTTISSTVIVRKRIKALTIQINQ